MFMEIAIGAIGIGVVLMVGYLVIAQVRAALPTPQETYTNHCAGLVGIGMTGNTTGCYNTTIATYYDGAGCMTQLNLTASNASATVSCNSPGFVAGMTSTQATVFAGFGLIAVGIIVLAAFGLINIFK